MHKATKDFSGRTEELQLLAIFPDEDVRGFNLGTDFIPFPSYLIFSRPNELKGTGNPFKSYETLIWRNPYDKEYYYTERDQPTSIPPDIQPIITHRFMYNPLSLVTELPSETLDLIYPSNIEFIRRHTYIFSRSHGDSVTPNLPPQELLWMYRPFIPIPVSKRGKEQRGSLLFLTDGKQKHYE